MHRNLTNRIETVVPVPDPALRRALDRVIEVYETDNCSAWDCAPDGTYAQRRPPEGEPCRAVQPMFLEQAGKPEAAAEGRER